jgi:hypothetical protein
MDNKNPLWVQNRKDPDNWLVIPDFDSQPAPCNFVGFDFPIMNENTSGDSWDFFIRLDILCSARNVRGEARRRFQTLRQLEEAAASAKEMLHRGEPPNASENQGFALLYCRFFEGLRVCMKSLDGDKNGCLSAMALTMATATWIFSGKPIDAKEVSSGNTARLTATQKSEVVRLYARGRGMSERAIAMRLGVSRSTIHRALISAGVKTGTMR